MTTAAAQARRLSLARLEQAAGQAFGYDDDAPADTRSLAFVTPATVAWATVATAVAATITYLV